MNHPNITNSYITKTAKSGLKNKIYTDEIK